MMKRYIHIIVALVAVTLLFSGCVELQTTRTTSNISFLPLIGHDTRAVESVPFPQDRSFKVWAVNQASGDVYIEGTNCWKISPTLLPVNLLRNAKRKLSAKHASCRFLN